MYCNYILRFEAVATMSACLLGTKYSSVRSGKAMAKVCGDALLLVSALLCSGLS